MCKCACSYLCEYDYVLYSTSKFLHTQGIGIAIILITHAHGALLCFIRLSSCRLCNLQNGCILNTRKWTTTLELASTEHLRCWGFAFIAINNTTYQLLSNKTDSRTASSAIEADCKSNNCHHPIWLKK